ncbi:MAG: glycoside hydrolase family 2 sugar binding protein, partial [Microbacteriaceae bacterium]|nr:glycoside hydrolase family 2 sugar binding protein [Microbacteriaceae bacterium]
MSGEHPRPQLTRERWTNLNGPWQFAIDDGDIGRRDGWHRDPTVFDREIVVPFPPESELSGIVEDGLDIVWYRRVVRLSGRENGNRFILHFEAVDYSAEVWINGQHVGGHEGGQTGFGFDITDALIDGPEQVIVLRAHDDHRDLEQPRGKQDWMPDPHVIWYRRTTGIWRTVWLEELPERHIASVVWLPTASPGAVDVEVRLAGHTGPELELELLFSIGGATLARSSHSVTAGVLRATVHLEDQRLHAEPAELCWSPEHPRLIDVVLRLRSSGELVDEARSYLGLRTVGVDEHAFLLNGRPYFLRLVLEQGYWPKTHLASPSEADLRREVELIKSLGFNGIRMHQVVADPRFLYWCDRLGLLVWVDAAASYRFSSVSFARTTREWMGIVERDISHPGVVAWVPFNESWGVPLLETSAQQRSAVAAVHHLIKAVDPTRPVLGNDGWEYVVGDLLGIHDYSQDPVPLRERYGDDERVAAAVLRGRAGGRRVAVV